MTSDEGPQLSASTSKREEPGEVDRSIEASRARMNARSTAFMAELSAEQLAREDQLPHVIATENASVKTG